ncbi:MAG: carboxylating nicotinate-nucleotide diphosphorylase [Saprospiraceae bacterium]|nr:carboxylating nicotinate-nucleotide diphosphorylase [Saprospiraceae bacterium]
MEIPKIDQDQLKAFITAGLDEDVKDGDHTSLACIPQDSIAKARLIFKDAGVIAGISIAEQIFQHVDPNAKVTTMVEDGAPMDYGMVAFEVECNAQALLMAERLVLNTMQRLSGIATMSNRFAFEVEDLPVTVLDTRKTTPLLRFLEKWAVQLGGCSNYRVGLYDRFMIKDNHIDACGGIKKAIEKVTAYNKENQLDLAITIEVRNLEELDQVLEVGQVDRIMLDNFELPILKEAVIFIDGRFETEASGGVNISTIREIAKTGVNFVSVGALTHSSQSLDMSLKIIKE